MQALLLPFGGNRYASLSPQNTRRKRELRGAMAK